MSNEPNQPAGDEPTPAAGQAGPDAKPGLTGGPAPDASPTAAPGAGSGATPAPVAGAPVETGPAETAPGPERYLIAPGAEEREEPAAAGGGAPVKKILIAALAVLVLVGGFFAIRYFVSANSTASAGDCVSLAQQDDNRADVKNLDCGDDKASYKVGKVLDTADAVCPEEGLYTEVSPVGGVGDGYKLCLLPNMAEGACYKPDEGTGFVKAECTGPETIKVTKVIKDSTDLTQCPDSAGMSYPEPAVTYCLAPAEV
ncbi:hypothetical protein ABZ816_06840 [Actinosynnema sp. NPDC047251]|uniref:Uncharacterized protein n=1 Tax=Saccharothrix espanaensis (strain ATCC 51144 / DSM 44229 / JCM 9112 / NBRC 15066 / NRRL 15764) TaxID=1179773 RepID=K0JR89_SACES|nr:hypothetical protein [Saccharothrix espanaensis]CCH27827.1 hypothetical protein BN6_04960 [Saccharothrix espanaensis DSM 44229]